MLTGLGLRNFKAFGDEMQEAPLSKITLIYGPNSGGKSSIIQALLLLKQSIKNKYTDEKRKLTPRGDFVDLGSFQSLLHKHDEGRNLGIRLSYLNLEQGARDNVLMNFSPLGTLLDIQYRIAWKDSVDALFDATIESDAPEHFRIDDRSLGWNARFRILNVDSEKVLYHFSEEFLPTLGFCELERVRTLEQTQTLQRQIENAKNELKRADTVELGQIFELTPVSANYTRVQQLEETREQALEQAQMRANQAREEILALKRSWAQQQIMREMLELEQEHDQTVGQALDSSMERAKQEVSEQTEPALEQLEPTPEHTLALTPENIPGDYERHLTLVNYLGPLRNAPERLYRLSDAGDSSVGIQGEYSANVLYHSRDVLDAVNEWLKQFDVPHELDVLRSGEASLAGEHITIAFHITDSNGDRIKDAKGQDVTVTIADVGYGISQLLPVIIEGIASQEGSILCVEQPEIHLHPRLQANIADLMIDTIADEPGKRKQWIVKTHSDQRLTAYTAPPAPNPRRQNQARRHLRPLRRPQRRKHRRQHNHPVAPRRKRRFPRPLARRFLRRELQRADG